MNLDISDRAINKRVRYLQQRVSITGIGNETFDEAVVNLTKIQAIFKQTISDQVGEDPLYSDYKGYRALNASNQYFTPRDDRSKNNSTPLGIDVDPHNYLQQAAENGYIHTSDNKVYYYEKGVSKDGKTL